jgi:hypothetical protein
MTNLALARNLLALGSILSETREIITHGHLESLAFAMVVSTRPAVGAILQNIANRSHNPRQWNVPIAEVCEHELHSPICPVDIDSIVTTFFVIHCCTRRRKTNCLTIRRLEEQKHPSPAARPRRYSDSIGKELSEISDS